MLFRAPVLPALSVMLILDAAQWDLCWISKHASSLPCCLRAPLVSLFKKAA